MSNRQVFILQMVLTTFIYSLIAKWYVAPALESWSLYQVLGLLLLPHALRHIGMTSIVSAVVDPAIPKRFSKPVAYGDLLSQILAMLTILLLRGHSPIAIAMVWIANIVGAGDWTYAGLVATKYRAFDYKLGAFWFLPTFFVPILIVTHFWMFWLLLH